MSRKSALMASILGVSWCAGCAQTPRLDIATSGSLPAATSSYSLVERMDTPASITLSACLAAHGMQVSNKPAYLAQLIETDRPGPVGAMSLKSGAAVKSSDSPWLPGAAPDRRAVRSLTFSLIRASTGQLVYRIAVSERYRPKAKGQKPTDLAQIACTNFASQPVPAAE